MHQPYRIRVAVAGDVEQVLNLDREIETVPHWHTRDYLSALPLPGRDAGIEGIIRCFYVAEVHSELVGFAVGKVMGAAAELESVGVAERMRRLGLGRALCATVIEWARGIGASEIGLEVRSRSAGPIAMYEEIGFLAAGRRAAYYREPVDDALSMRLDLPSSTRAESRQGGDL